MSLKSSRKPVLNFKKSSSSSRLIKSFFNLKKKIALPKKLTSSTRKGEKYYEIYKNENQKFGFIKRVDKGWITTAKDLESWRFER